MDQLGAVAAGDGAAVERVVGSRPVTTAIRLVVDRWRRGTIRTRGMRIQR